MTSGDHVHIECDNAIINRVTYRVSSHVHLIDGEWKMRDYRELYMSRRGSHEGPTNAARNRAAEIILSAWAAFRATPEFKVVAKAAELGYLEARLKSADETIVDCEKKLQEARAERAKLRAKLKALDLTP